MTIPRKKILQKILNSFSRKQTLIFTVLFIILSVSTISILGKINKNFMSHLPEHGGALTEGVMGTPRFINPLLALSDTDRDLGNLIYSGLMKKTPNGTIVNDLAESYTVSPDGLVYTFRIKPEAVFHDKFPVTAADIAFTIERAKDPLIKSPLAAVWEGVEVLRDDSDPRIVTFRLSQSYAAFLDNATIGILPKHVWDNLASEEFNLAEQNLEAIGSGPYKIKNIDQKRNGLIEKFELVSFNDYASAKPFINKINFKFFKNESDLVKQYRKGRVDQISSISPKAAKALEGEGFTPTTAVLSRIFGIFLNPNHNEILRDKEIVRAIDLGVDKVGLVNKVLYGFGIPLDGPIPKSLANGDFVPANNGVVAENQAAAEQILENKGWKKAADGIRTKDGKKLEFSISTADVAELRAASEIIKADLEIIGVRVNIKVFEVGILNQNVIRPREYEALFFGQVIRNESDLFAFWHSSQRNDPGLNIAVYTNSKVDKLLEELVATTDQTLRKMKMNEFAAQIKEDRPAIFIYSPEFIYMESEKVKGVELDHITSSSERFLGIKDWYIRTDAVWKFWLKESN